MSRAVATTNPTTHSYPEMQLVVQISATGEPGRSVVRSSPFGESNLVDFGALVIFSMLLRHMPLEKLIASSDETTKTMPGLKWEYGAFRNTCMNYDIWTLALSWLLDENAFQLFIPMMASEHFQIPKNHQERLEKLAIPLRKVESSVRISTNLFAKNYQRWFVIACLLDATLNVDRAAVEQILDGEDDATIRVMLSTSGTAVIEHLGIKRTGTALQMAFYSHDEKMFEFLKNKMDPKEVFLQCQKVFDDYGVRNYGDLIKKQIAKAQELCGELEREFRPESPDCVPCVTSSMQDALDRFNINLSQYVKANPVHNAYILQCLVEIYENLPFFKANNLECLISQKAIGLVQKLSSACWLQHNAQGVYNLVCGEVAAPSPSFLCVNMRQGANCTSPFPNKILPSLDVRSHVVLSRLGVDSCIDIYGRLSSGPSRIFPFGKSAMFRVYGNLNWRKTASFEKFIQAVQQLHQNGVTATPFKKTSSH
ncbi:MAG: hypothetical protein A3E82_03730 [Gammaproteobacteria bacterium RIFCSPHIGHO2_12_FULL_38_11]|nr:MAG: hypothetical protein A3E82_03730 [Gammaproteobacteria bacterium RIFCSPHIGHO2_12_FULL_38_11]